jgi:hypothetical protein
VRIHFTQIVAFQVEQLTAFNAFQMKMLIADACPFHILITCTFSPFDEISPHAALGHQLVQIAIHRGFAY